jgi:UDP-N-acetyl-D-glucosamine dehydrogenase
MPDYVLRRLVLAFNHREMAVRGKRVLVLGIAYKKNTGDARESPALEILQQLVAMGANVAVSDPHVDDRHVPSAVERVDCTREEVARADAVVLLVDHDAFDYHLLEAASYVFDCRHRVPAGPNVEYL